MISPINASSPLGIDAVKKLNAVKNKSETTDPDKANNDMIMFVVFNCASVQIIPTTLIALRSAAGSKDVFGIIPAVWVCSLMTAAFAVAAVKILRIAFLFAEKRKISKRKTNKG